MSDEIIDMPEVLERIQDDKAFLVELLDIYQEDFLKKRAALKEAVEAKDLPKIRETAHSMKGSSGNISAKRIFASCLAMERCAKENDVAGIADLAKVIDVQFAELQRFAAELKKEFS